MEDRQLKGNITMKPRVTAVKILYQVLEKGVSLNSAILANLPKNSSESSLVKELCYGSLRWYFRLDTLLGLLMKTPLKPKDRDISILLLIGLYQILYLRVAEHAAVSETVEAAKLLKKNWASKLINGVLRTCIRNKDELVQRLDSFEQAKYAHPDWLISAIRHAWSGQWQTILEANNQHPPLCLRINRLQINREQWLSNSEIKGTVLAHPETALIIPPQDVMQLPGFKEGQFSVQDAAAQLAAEVLMLAPGQRVLDACAAPGGKTAHIAETEVDLKEIIAIDNSQDRLEQAKSNWQRLKLNTRISWLINDATKPDQWWDGQMFDRILVDAPCSATGVIRRHPDIKILRRKSDIKTLVQQQEQLLNTLWQLLHPGAVLVYATCSILPEENSQQIENFLSQHPDAREIKIEAKWGSAQAAGRQILPTAEMDGFYYARLEKRSG